MTEKNTRKRGPAEPAAPNERRALLIDHDGAYRDRLRARTRRFGCQLDWIPHSTPVVDALEACRASVVVIAHRADNGDTFEALEAVRRAPGWRRLPIAIVRSETDPDFDLDAYRRGADVVLRRSHSVAAVAAWIEGRLGTHPASQPDSDPVPPDVVVVEDDPSMREMLEYGLTNRGFRVVSYADGRRARRALLEMETGNRQPVVVLDVDLPGLGGFQLLTELSDIRPGDYKVVLCTGQRGEASQVLGIEAGAVDYIIKPVQMPVLEAKVARLAAAARTA